MPRRAAFAIPKDAGRRVQEKFTGIHSHDTPQGWARRPDPIGGRPTARPIPTRHKFAETGLNHIAAGNMAIVDIRPQEVSDQPANALHHQPGER
jgi:hypothetical protein